MFLCTRSISEDGKGAASTYVMYVCEGAIDHAVSEIELIMQSLEIAMYVRV